MKGYVYIQDNKGYLLTATDYRYVVNEDDNLNEWLDFSILRPDDTIKNTLLYIPVDQFSISVDSYYFGNLISYKDWKQNQELLNIAEKYMKP